MLLHYHLFFIFLFILKLAVSILSIKFYAIIPLSISYLLLFSEVIPSVS